VGEAQDLRLIDALHALADELVAQLDADACILSRVLGDVLIIVTQTATDADLVNLGQGFLVSDFPATKAVLDTGAPATLTLADAVLDEAEAQLLRDLGYASLLMLPLWVAGEQWGLIEVYRRDVRAFTVADADLARSLGRVG
jgi:transcriptional regulator with GAF, ATPase, and Fis domain